MSQASLRVRLCLAACWLWRAGRLSSFWPEHGVPVWLVGRCTARAPRPGVQACCAPTLTPRGGPPELPVSILRPLRDKIAMEKHRGVLECQMSRASAQVRWFKGSMELHPGAKYEMVSDGLYRKLVINAVQPEDEDTYTCDAGDVKTSAHFFVEGLGRAGWKLPFFPRRGFVACGTWRLELPRWR